MNLMDKTDDEILSVADPIMDNLMEASTAIDYERHVRDFTARAKGVLSEALLRHVCREYQSSKGFFAEREFVAFSAGPIPSRLSGNRNLPGSLASSWPKWCW